MGRLKYRLLLAMLLLPFAALAHGEEVLITLLIVPISIIVFLIFLSAIKIATNAKITIAIVYSSTLFLTFIGSNYLPYLDNKHLINNLLIFLPIIAIALTYIILYSMGKTHIKK